MFEKTNDSLVVNTTEGLNKEVGANNTSYTKSLTDNTPVLTCGSLCGGIGSDAVALKNLNINHRTKILVEIDQDVVDTYKLNHKVDNVYSDITTINPHLLAKVDLLCISVPCTSFSISGKRLPILEDTRGSLFYYAFNILKINNPKFFLFENVEGLLSHQEGSTWNTILTILKGLNYNIQYKVLNAKNYGAAENRKRLFIIGTRKDIKEEFSFPESQPVSNSVDNYIVKGADYSDCLFDSTKCIPFTAKKNTDIKTVYKLPHLKFAADARVISSNSIAPCILSSSAYTKFYDEKNKIFRYLRNSELAEIQGFKSFKWSAGKTKTKRMIGNAINIHTLEAIFTNLIPSKYFAKSAVSSSLGDAA